MTKEHRELMIELIAVAKQLDIHMIWIHVGVCIALDLEIPIDENKQTGYSPDALILVGYYIHKLNIDWEGVLCGLEITDRTKQIIINSFNNLKENKLWQLQISANEKIKSTHSSVDSSKQSVKCVKNVSSPTVKPGMTLKHL